MDLDDLLFRYLSAHDLDDVPASALDAGVERTLVDFGLERDRESASHCGACCTSSRPSRTSMWRLLMRPTGTAARNFMDLLAGSTEGE